MYFDPKCVSCLIKQAYNAAELFAFGNKEMQLKIVKEACTAALSITEDFMAPEFSPIIQSIIEKNLGLKDPYASMKERNFKKAEKFIPYVEALVGNTDNKLEMAIRAAIAGNTIDYGANPDFDIGYEIKKIATNNINLDAFNKFSNDLNNASSILYIGDNFEEGLFDKILLKQLLPREVIFAVRSAPILNDMTLEDAKTLGIDRICKVIESGSKIAGTDLAQCSREFLDLFEKADMVIAKGQGNFETLLNVKRPVYFLFKVKCDVIADRCGMQAGTSALYLND